MSHTITLEQAQSVIAAAAAKATEIGVLVNIAIVDAGNNLTAFARQDDAWLGSIDLAQSKAYTARAFNLQTKDLAARAQPGQPIYGINTASDGRIIIFPGGIPLTDGDTVIGAIGVSGATVAQDQEIAEAGVAAL